MQWPSFAQSVVVCCSALAWPWASAPDRNTISASIRGSSPNPEFGAFIYPPRIAPRIGPALIDRACMRVATTVPKPPNRRGFNLRGLGRLKSKRLRIALRAPTVDIQKSALFWMQSFFRAWFGMFIASAPRSELRPDLISIETGSHLFWHGICLRRSRRISRN